MKLILRRLLHKIGLNLKSSALSEDTKDRKEEDKGGNRGNGRKQWNAQKVKRRLGDDGHDEDINGRDQRWKI